LHGIGFADQAHHRHRRAVRGSPPTAFGFHHRWLLRGLRPPRRSGQIFTGILV